MASDTETDVKECVGKNIPGTKRKLQKHLRSIGLPYVSRTGKIIPAKQIPDEICQCPHKCNDLIPYLHRELLFTHFYHILGDIDAQNKFLRRYMEVRARLHLQPVIQIEESTGNRPPRRITCKYLIPQLIGDHLDTDVTMEVCHKAFCSIFAISTKRVRLQREKLIHSLGLNSYHYQRHPKRKKKVPEGDGQPQEPEKFQPEMKQQKCFVDDPLIPLGISVPEGVTIAPVIATPDHDRDVAIVNNFFSNQLWKPEYIGAYS